MPRVLATNRLAIRNYNAAIAFDGSASLLTKTTPTGLNTGGSSLSFVTWAYLNTSNIYCIADLVAPVMGRRFSLGYSGGTCFFFSDGVNGANNLTLNDTQFQMIGTNRFVRLGWSLTSTAVSLYANGALVKTQSLGITMNSGTYSKLTFGATGTGLQPLLGSLTDAYFTNSAMTLTEFQADFFNATYPSNLASAWLMGEGAGTNIVDRIGTNNLTATSITWTANTPTKSRKRSMNANMVVNGDFEYGTGSAATSTSVLQWVGSNFMGWGAGAQSSVTGTVSYDTSKSFSGLQSIKVAVTAITGTLRGAFAANAHDNPAGTFSVANTDNSKIRVQPNTSYTFSARAWNNSATGSQVGNITLNDFTEAGVSIGQKLNLTTIGSGAWELLSGLFTTGTNASFVAMTLFAKGVTGETPIVWYDDVTIIPVYPEGRVPANGNLVKNFNFEVAPTFVAATTTANRFIDGTSGGSTSNGTYKWAIAGTVGTVAAQFDSSVFNQGLSSLKISTTATGSKIDVAQFRTESAANVVSFGIAAKANTSYTYSIAIKTSLVSGSASTGMRMQFIESDANDANKVTNTVVTGVVTTTGWTVYTSSFTTAATTTYIFPYLTIAGNDGAATLIMDAWFDDLYLAPTTNPGRVLIT